MRDIIYAGFSSDMALKFFSQMKLCFLKHKSEPILARSAYLLELKKRLKKTMRTVFFKLFYLNFYLFIITTYPLCILAVAPPLSLPNPSLPIFLLCPSASPLVGKLVGVQLCIKLFFKIYLFILCI